MIHKKIFYPKICPLTLKTGIFHFQTLLSMKMLYKNDRISCYLSNNKDKRGNIGINHSTQLPIMEAKRHIQ